MTHPALIERITRSLAYMLRHQPEQFDLELDEFGWADLREVVRALNERLGEPTSAEDVQEAVSSGDRQRYEIDRGMIRALYGHSIDVQPGEPAQPPELLYVGVSRQDAERAERFGLRPGRRRFLHLALTSEDALETAARSSEDAVLVKVHAMDAWEEGINFYDRKALFLSDPIPTHYLEITEVAPHEEHSRERSHAAAPTQEASEWGGHEQAPAEEGEPVESSEAPRGFSAPPQGDGGGRRRRGRRGGRGRGREFSDDRPRPPAEPAVHERSERPAPPMHEDRPRPPAYGRDDRPRHGHGGGPRPGGPGPRQAHPGGHGGQGGGYGGPRGERGGFREERGRPFQDDRPPRQDRPQQDRPPQDRPRQDDRGPAPERGGWQGREERPRHAPAEGEFGAGTTEPRRPAPPAQPAPPPPRVEPPKPAPKPARRETSDDSFGAGL